MTDNYWLLKSLIPHDKHAGRFTLVHYTQVVHVCLAIFCVSLGMTFIFADTNLEP